MNLRYEEQVNKTTSPQFGALLAVTNKPLSALRKFHANTINSLIRRGLIKRLAADSAWFLLTAGGVRFMGHPADRFQEGTSNLRTLDQAEELAYAEGTNRAIGAELEYRTTHVRVEHVRVGMLIPSVDNTKWVQVTQFLFNLDSDTRTIITDDGVERLCHWLDLILVQVEPYVRGVPRGGLSHRITESGDVVKGDMLEMFTLTGWSRTGPVLDITPKFDGLNVFAFWGPNGANVMAHESTKVAVRGHRSREH